MNVEMIGVNSSNVKSVGYDEIGMIVYVSFLNNSLYTYSGVPLNIYEGLRDASSVGKYLNQNIKGNYPYCKIG